MSRDGAGNYTLPLPPVSPGDIVESTWANTTLADLRDAMTDSLSRSGQGGMTAQFAIDDGVVTSPGLQFTAEANSGIYRALAFDVRMAIGGVDLMRWTTANGTQLWDGALWKSLIFDAPADGTYYSRIDNSWAVDPIIAQNSVDIVTNADQIALNIVNISTNATNIGINAAAIADTVEEAPIDGGIYSRMDATWVATPGGANPDDLITAQSFDGTTLLSTRTNGDFTTILKDFDVVVATSFKSDGPIRHLSAVITTSLDPANGNRYTMAPAVSQDLDFTLPSGIDTDLGESYEVEGSVLIKNAAAAVTITLKEDGGAVPAGQILGTQPTASGVSYLLSYIIHRSAGAPDTYTNLYIWSA